MLRQIVAGLAAGIAFLVLDGLLDANALAQQVYTMTVLVPSQLPW